MPSDLTESRVRSELVRYLNGRGSLEDFYAWLIPATWDIDDCAPKGLRHLVYGIKLYLAEYSRGHRSDEDLRSRLASLAGVPLVTKLNVSSAVTTEAQAWLGIIATSAAQAVDFVFPLVRASSPGIRLELGPPPSQSRSLVACA